MMSWPNAKCKMGVAGAALGLLVLLPYSKAMAQDQNSVNSAQTAAQELFQDANEDRASQGLPPLKQDAALAAAAQKHAEIMVQQGSLSHQFSGEPGLIERVQQQGVHCTTVAENIASGPTANRINEEWMHSPSHRANLLDPHVNTIGIAVIRHNGALYAVQDFARETTQLGSSQQERQLVSLLHGQGIPEVQASPEARTACNTDGNQIQPMPRSIMHFGTSDLSRLPQQVQQALVNGHYRKALVGACGTSLQNGFSAYQMVIVLY